MYSSKTIAPTQINSTPSVDKILIYADRSRWWWEICWGRKKAAKSSWTIQRQNTAGKWVVWSKSWKTSSIKSSRWRDLTSRFLKSCPTRTSSINELEGSRLTKSRGTTKAKSRFWMRDWLSRVRRSSRISTCIATTSWGWSKKSISSTTKMQSSRKLIKISDRLISLMKMKYRDCHRTSSSSAKRERKWEWICSK